MLPFVLLFHHLGGNALLTVGGHLQEIDTGRVGGEVQCEIIALCRSAEEPPATEVRHRDGAHRSVQMYTDLPGGGVGRHRQDRECPVVINAREQGGGAPALAPVVVGVEVPEDKIIAKTVGGDGPREGVGVGDLVDDGAPGGG